LALRGKVFVTATPVLPSSVLLTHLRTAQKGVLARGIRNLPPRIMTAPHPATPNSVQLGAVEHGVREPSPLIIIAGALPYAPADLLDDNAVVPFAFAVVQASLQHRGVDCKQRQFLPDLTRLLEH